MDDLGNQDWLPAAEDPAHAGVEALFYLYEVACSAMDPYTASRFYDFPCLIGTPEKSYVYVDAGTLREALEQLFAFYRRQGVAQMSIHSLRIESLSSVFAKIAIVWRLQDAQGRAVIDSDCTYLLRRCGAAGNIVVSLAHNETARFAERAGERAGRSAGKD